MVISENGNIYSLTLTNDTSVSIYSLSHCMVLQNSSITVVVVSTNSKAKFNE